ncbi:D-aspartate oxidase [Gracilaria domingensis]|nr:D-aspartate oxidase [Gracilaria domingensis]
MPFALEGEEIEEWATTTYNTLKTHVEENVGVTAMDALYLYARGQPEIPWYSDLTDMKLVGPQEDKRVPADYRCALRFKTVVVQMNVYLMYLESCLVELGVPVHSTREFSKRSQSFLWDMGRVSQFAKSIAHDTIVVNCAGIGARFLADEDLIPGRGILLRVKRPPEVNYVITEDPYDAFQSRDGLLAYAIPRGDEISLGGTLFKGDWNEEASDEEVDAVRKRAEQLLPIKGMAETGRWSGLRPFRLDGKAKVKRESRNVISNYGHGGSGVTICWGCAESVVKLVAGDE